MVKFVIWQEFHLVTSSSHAHEISEQLTALGAVAVTFQDAGDEPIFEPQPESEIIWPETNVTGLFEESAPTDEVVTFLENQQALGKVKQFHLKQLADENWERRCLEGFEPICCGDRLWICPSWKKPPMPKAVNIILDPGLAFGTGTHPTTKLCLEWLDKHIQNQPCIIDYGCGSGILAIAALKLGACQAIAIDNDPQALEATRANAERNAILPVHPPLSTQVIRSSPLIIQDSSQEIHAQADVILANILAKPLIDLAYFFNEHLKPGGHIVLSGILKEQIEAILQAYSPWFSIEKTVFSSNWALIEGVKKNAVMGKNLN